MTDANGNTVNTEYDKLGRAIKVQTPFDDTVSGETKTYYDKNSNIIKTAVKRSENKDQIEEYKYDNMGNLLASITNDGKTDTVTQYKYDTANRVTKMITGLSAYSENPAGGAVTQYSYNNLGYLAKTTDPMGLSETYNSYDYAGNLLSVTDKNSNTMYNTYGTYGLVKSYFNNSPETKEYTYNKIGQVTSAKSVNANEQSVEENYSYDPFGRLISSISNDGSVQNYTYDANSNVETYELVEDDVVKNSIEYAYNTLNQMTTLTNNGIVTSYTYDANGNLTNKLLSTGVNTNYTYNKAGLMTYMESKKGSNVYTYSKCKYLLNGLVNRVDMQYDNNPAEGKIKYYNYDDAGRLIADNITNAAGFPVANSYEYDLYGNRVKMVSSPGDEEETETINYEYDLNNRLLNENSYVYNSYRNTDSYSSTHYYYDYNGNMTAKQKTYFGGSNNNNAVLSGRSTDTGLSVYRYDAFNRLANYNSGSNEASYTYNANNLRTSKTVNREKTNFVWNGQNLAAENKTDITNTYTYDMTGVHIANQNGTVTSYLKDYHGNIAGKTTKTGAMFNEMGTTMDYDAFGNQWQGDVPDPFGYCGEYLDGESGLIYLRNRYYDSMSGRFITEDPIKDGLNWYAYAENNPIIMIDPNGLDSYIFYTSSHDSDFSKQAQWQKKYLEGLGERVIMREVNSVDEFVYEWDIMGYDYDIGQSVSVNKVVIYAHGHENALIFEDGSSTNAISLTGKNRAGDDIANLWYLKKKNINDLYILSCNAGHLSKYTKGHNVASAFSCIVSGNVHAYDGNVAFGKGWWDANVNGNYSSRLSNDQSAFHDIAKTYGTDRNPVGYIKYYKGKYIR